MTTEELASELQRYGVVTMNRWATDGAALLRSQVAEIETLESELRTAAVLIQQRDTEIEALRKQLYESKHCQCGYDDVCDFAREAETLRVDALRYRWLKSKANIELRSDGSTWTKNGVKFVASHRLCTGHTAHGHYATLDETIDAAIEMEARK